MRPRITVVGLGPAGPDLVTDGTQRALVAADHVYLRTRRHPAAELVPDAPSFDHVYESSDHLDEVYPRIVEELVDAAHEHGEILYAVPGSPVVAERTVELLQDDARVAVLVEPALSFVDLAWVRLGVDPLRVSARIIDGHRFEVDAAGERGPLLVAQCDSAHVLSDIKLAIADALETRSTFGSGLAPRAPGESGPGLLPDDLHVTVLQRLGLPDESRLVVRWDELDRTIEPDHLTSLWIPEYAAPVAREVQRFAELVGTLRRECPWDREQTHESLKRHLIEEAYEVLDAIDHVDPDEGTGYEHLEEELGDLLFQVLFHATLAAEAGQFTLSDVARTVHDKLYSRHPHVFGDVAAHDADQVAANWEDLKKREKGRESVFDGIPDALPALLFALKVQKKAAALELGSTVKSDAVPRASAPVVSPELSVAEALAVVDTLNTVVGDEVARAGALGNLLFAAVARARMLGVDPETALRSATRAYLDAHRAAELG